ncbi:MAG: NAD(P)/FAD-dependent oxidoreductase [Cellvibrionaceae bacterium]
MEFNQVTVIGGGMGGLAAAAALAPFCKKITIFDKDKIVDGVRKAVPQGAHIHILLRAGLNALDELLPGMPQELESRGSARINLGTDQQIHEFGQWMPSRDLDLYFLSQSRPFLEKAVRERLLQLNNIELIDNTTVEQVLFPEKGQSGNSTVKLKSGETIASDIVVDAGGAGGPIIRQINKTLETPVETDTFETGIFYSTVHFDKVSPWDQLQENILIIPDPGHSSIGGSLLSIENGQWCVSLHGRKGSKPPSNYDEWQILAKNLPDSRIWERIQHAKPRDDIKNFKKPLSTWRRFDKIDYLPYGYLPTGDTFTSFNPIYGQGMTVALGHAISLRHCMSENERNFDTFRKNYIEKASKWSKEAWQRATSYDSYYTNAKDKQSQLNTIRKLVMAQHSKAEKDPVFHKKIASQSQMLLIK